MKKNTTAVFAAGLCLASVVASAGPKPEDFRGRLTALAENEKLTKKYGIRGFPTALILDDDGRKIAETGYRRGGAAKYAEHLMGFRKK